MPVKRTYHVVIEKDGEGWLVASVPELPGCHTQARTMDKLMVRIKEAIALCVEEYGTPGSETEFVGIQRVMVEA
jgi:predicted RNase H-like HicB family nuclease